MDLFSVNTIKFKMSRKAFLSSACRIMNLFFFVQLVRAGLLLSEDCDI
jgi:hypothetical protein